MTGPGRNTLLSGIDEKSNKDVIYITAFDNGDGRHLEQPAIASMKYSRAVVFKIDQKKMTVQQIWEYGKERGNEWYSPVTSLTKYYKDKTLSSCTRHCRHGR